MFSGLRQRVGPASSTAARQPSEDELATQRQQLQRVLREELAPNNEACAVATNGMVLLREDVEARRRGRDDRRAALAAARRELAALEDDLAREHRGWARDVGDAARLTEEGVRAREEAAVLREDTPRARKDRDHLEEAMHRNRCHVENLKLEWEKEAIRKRHLTDQQRDLALELRQLQALREAQQIAEARHRRELEEARTTREMYRAHHESLTLHMKQIGGDPGRFQFGSIFRTKHKTSACQEPAATCPTHTAADDVRKPPRSLPQVGGVVYGADATRGGTGGEDSSNFLRKWLPAFKLGAAGGAAAAAATRRPPRREDHVLRLVKEVEFSSDAQSRVSTLTMDGDDTWDETWKDSLSDEEVAQEEKRTVPSRTPESVH